MKFDLNLIRSLYTLCFFCAFVVLCIYVYSPKQKKFYEKVKMLPFTESEVIPEHNQSEEP